MTSSSSGATSVIVLQFNLSLNIDIAEEEVQSAINAAQSFLPANLPSPPIYSKTNPADAPVLTLAVSSKTIPLPQVEDLVDTRLAPKISQLREWGWSASAVVRNLRCAFKQIRPRCHRTGSTWKTCGPPLRKQALTQPRETLMATARIFRSTRMTNCKPAKITGKWWWLTVTARR